MDSDGYPHQALFFVLAYLPLEQLLLMNQVCMSLRYHINHDVLLWRDIIVRHPLSIRITDEVLMKITSKSRRRLRTLALLHCTKVTDDGLMSVVRDNPFISKLYVPGCTSLTPEGFVRAVLKLAERGDKQITRLQINGIYNLQQEHLLTLNANLAIPKSPTKNPRFYHKYRPFSFHSLDKDDKPIDVEICPRCAEARLVFDCPRTSCKMIEQRERGCWGCLHCIPRCEGCGRCITDASDEQGETICNDVVCLDCWLCLEKCNLCNKPLCPRHTDKQPLPPVLQGFICNVYH